ncbi:MAG TPA: hypothetical protein VGH93_06605, partial [Solirubrobacteraceae bacterium]
PRRTGSAHHGAQAEWWRSSQRLSRLSSKEACQVRQKQVALSLLESATPKILVSSGDPQSASPAVWPERAWAE